MSEMRGADQPVLLGFSWGGGAPRRTWAAEGALGQVSTLLVVYCSAVLRHWAGLFPGGQL